MFHSIESINRRQVKKATLTIKHEDAEFLGSLLDDPNLQEFLKHHGYHNNCQFLFRNDGCTKSIEAVKVSDPVEVEQSPIIN